MSIIFFEGFETVGTLTGLANQATTRPHVHKRWSLTASGGAPATDSYFTITDAFSEGYALQMGSNSFSNGNYLRHTFASGQRGVGASATEFLMGVRVHIPDPANTFSIMQVYNSYGSGGSADFSINCVSSADVSVSRFVGGTIETATGVFTAGSWHYVEMAWTISSGSTANGKYDVYVDGVQVMVDTTARTNGNFFSNTEYMRFNNISGASTVGDDYVAYDDIYLLEVDATAPNDFLGSKVRVLSLPPDADAGTNQWTLSSGSAAHYTYIDENGADSADYLQESTNGNADMFDFTDTAASGEFIATKVEAEAIAITTTSHTLDVRLNSNVTVTETNHAVTSTTAYIVVAHYDALDPNTGSAWTQGGIDAADVGIQFNT